MYKALVLRTCNADMTSYGGFVWPKEGHVVCPDWEPVEECGNGLHGALWGEGNGVLFSWHSCAVWQVVGINEWVDLEGKVKFPEGWVVFTGNQKDATDFIRANGASGAVIGATVVVGAYEMAFAGYKGTATAGDRGTATAGYGGRAIAEYLGTATAGDEGTATAGDEGTATAGDFGTASVGYKGTATTGDHGTAIAEDHGTAIAGYKGTATTGEWGKAKAGIKGILNITYYDGRTRTKTAYVGEDGIKPNVFYKLDENHNFVEA